MITMPIMPAAQERVWHSLFTLCDKLPGGWTLVGGQMVHLHCAERGRQPHRATTDGDIVVDIRADRHMLAQFTSELLQLGYASDGVSAEGHEHRWRDGDAVIDVLIATNLGRSQGVTGVTGSTTVGASGAQQALDRSELVEVSVAGRTGRVRRPNLVGALVIKGAATSAPSGDSEQHKADFALLATMIVPEDDFTGLTQRDRQHLDRGSDAARQSVVAHQVPEWETGLARLARAMNRNQPSPRTPGRAGAPATFYPRGAGASRGEDETLPE
ncbi:MAG: hypothetical protein LWW77_12555 [Propionibacteriales bacterium]|nr:hypothetical protein [Propionibacteriales bacterium]